MENAILQQTIDTLVFALSITFALLVVALFMFVRERERNKLIGRKDGVKLPYPSYLHLGLKGEVVERPVDNEQLPIIKFSINDNPELRAETIERIRNGLNEASNVQTGDTIKKEYVPVNSGSMFADTFWQSHDDFYKAEQAFKAPKFWRPKMRVESVEIHPLDEGLIIDDITRKDT